VHIPSREATAATRAAQAPAGSAGRLRDEG